MRSDKGETTVVLLHLFGGSARTWDAVRAELSGVRCVAFDSAGFGGAPPHPDGFDLQRYADDVLSRVAALGLDRFVLVGHSMAGKIAQVVASRRPAGLAGIVLLAPSPLSGEPMDDAGRDLLRRARTDRVAAEQIAANVIKLPVSDARRAAFVDDMLAADAAAWDGWIDVGSGADLSALDGAIECPVSILSGEADAAVPRELVRREVADRIAGATMTNVPGGGHVLPLEAPAAVAEAIREMIEKTDGHEPSRQRQLPFALVETAYVTPATRRVLQVRAAKRPAASPAFFSDGELATLRAICLRLIPHEGTPAADPAGTIDQRLANNGGDGWRYDSMPPDAEAQRRAISALRAAGFDDASDDEKDSLLSKARDGADWPGVDSRRWLEETLAEAVEVFAASAAGTNHMNSHSFADARGWQRVGLDELEVPEQV